jgi:N-carbamoylputrescine amidase
MCAPGSGCIWSRKRACGSGSASADDIVRITVCELPNEPTALDSAWTALCKHTSVHASELVLLPEFAMVDAVWELELFDPDRWEAVERASEVQLQRLRELHAAHVVGTRPATIDGRRFNEGYIWSDPCGFTPLRRKTFLPAEPGCWEARWFHRGEEAFPTFRAGDLTFGLNICTELWALESYTAYAAKDVQVVLSPRATAAATVPKWLSVGVVGAVRSGAFSVSSNRVDPTGMYGGAGWIINPSGEILARTSAASPFATVDIDLAAASAARDHYPCYVLAGGAE